MAGEPHLPDRVREKAGAALSINGDGARDDGNGREDDGDLGVGVEAVVEAGGLVREWRRSGGGEEGGREGSRGGEEGVRVCRESEAGGAGTRGWRWARGGKDEAGGLSGAMVASIPRRCPT